MARGKIRKVTTEKRRQTRWQARFSAVDRTGVRRFFRRRFPTRKAAEEWLSDIEATVVHGDVPIAEDVTVEEYGELWMRRMAHDWAPSTRYVRRSAWKQRIAPVLGNHRLRDLTRNDCQQFVNDLVASGYSANYVRGIAVHLQAMLNAAVGDELIDRSPASRLTLPRVRRKLPKTWSAEQARAFLDATAGTQLHALAAVMLLTGARLGEALGLRWDAVDMQAGHLRIVGTMSLTDDGQHYVSPTTKTESSRRTVPINDVLAVTLKAHRAWQRQWLKQRGLTNRHNLLFLNNAGDPMHPSTARELLTDAMDDVGVERIPPHGMRHSAASLLLSAGVAPKVVQELLGHTSIATTLDIYSHLTPSMKQTATDQLGAMLGTTTSVAESDD